MSLFWFMFLITSIFRAWAWVDGPAMPPVERVAEDLVRRPPVAVADLDSIRRRGTLRVITRNTTTTYFIHRGRELGFEYELARAFARRLGVRLEMVIPPTYNDMIPWLLEGRGDVIAPGFLLTARTSGAALPAHPHDVASMVVVTRTDGGRIEKPEDLIGRRVHVRRDSPAHQALCELDEQLGGGIDIVVVDGTGDPESLLLEVAAGRIGATVAPLPVVRIEQASRPKLAIGTAIGEPDSVAWIVRPNATGLRNAVDRFFRDKQRTRSYAVLKRKYFEQQTYHAIFRAMPAVLRPGRVTPYDDLIRNATRGTGLDWRLVAAQMSRESKFDPLAESWMGAIGLMQLMPGTAAVLGVGNPWNPGENVRAGVRYLAAQIARFDSLGEEESVKFGLAAYNSGLGHVLDARELARRQGLDPNRWDGNVEATIQLLEREQFHTEAVYGFARGTETATYVNEIIALWQSYRVGDEAKSELPVL